MKEAMFYKYLPTVKFKYQDMQSTHCDIDGKCFAYKRVCIDDKEMVKQLEIYHWRKTPAEAVNAVAVEPPHPTDNITPVPLTDDIPPIPSKKGEK